MLQAKHFQARNTLIFISYQWDYHSLVASNNFVVSEIYIYVSSARKVYCWICNSLCCMEVRVPPFVSNQAAHAACNAVLPAQEPDFQANNMLGKF